MAYEPQTREDMIKEFLEEERSQGVQNDSVQEHEEEDDAAVLALPVAEDGEVEQDSDVLIAWDGPEFEVYERDKQWYVAASVVLLLIVAYAVIINSPIMAITFILIGVVGYIYLQKDPRDLVFAVTEQGVVVGDELFGFDEIESFWVFYEPPHTYLLSLALRNRMLPHVHIPLHQVDPVELRAALLEFVPEERQEVGIVDTLERLLHI